MKASELISLLNQKIELDGDLEVHLPPLIFPNMGKSKTDPPPTPIVGINTWCDLNSGRPLEFMIFDEGWAAILP